MIKRVHAIVHGRVQGVCFRAFTRDKAVDLDVVGWVRNLHDGTVELEAEAEELLLDDFMEAVGKGPFYARVDRLVVEPVNPLGEKGFAITV